ncbi:NAD(P)H-dependent glycerol-3-phosphate dehydrogenase [bacterium]|nr:NAD(P)H-dependent glycerol-3-phosphate dehydrogenase [bacterium]
MSNPARLTILGSGSWGATMAAMLARKGHEITLWGHDQAELDRLRAAGHPPGVPELRLPQSINLSSDLTDAVSGRDGMIFVVPAQAMDSVCGKLATIAAAPKVAVIASKGIDVRTLRPLSKVVEDGLPTTIVAVVSGPCIAREVAQGVPTSVVSASADEDTSRRVQDWMATQAFRVYRQSDVLGVEYGGALKNVIAIAAGVGDGLGFGANSKSALLTRGLAEMQRFAVAHGAQAATIAGLAGLGDLCVTCFSPHSRNRRFGEAVGRGEAPQAVIAGMGEVVEGVPTCEAVVNRAKELGIEVPIASAVHQIIHGKWTPREAVERLMTRDLKDEF